MTWEKHGEKENKKMEIKFLGLSVCWFVRIKNTFLSHTLPYALIGIWTQINKSLNYIFLKKKVFLKKGKKDIF